MSKTITPIPERDLVDNNHETLDSDAQQPPKTSDDNNMDSKESTRKRSRDPDWWAKSDPSRCSTLSTSIEYVERDVNDVYDPYADDIYPYELLAVPVPDPVQDITAILDEQRLKSYQRRLKIRSLKLYAVAARLQVPRETVAPWVEGDTISASTLQQFIKPYLETEGLSNDPAVDQTEDAAPQGGTPINPDEVKAYLDQKLDEAEKQTPLSKDQLFEFRTLMIKHLNELRTKFSDDPPAKLDPFKIRVQEGAQPKKAKCSRYSPNAYKILRETIEELIARKLIEPNINSRWAAPVHVIPKPGRPGEFRVVIDLRYINSVTIPTQWPMPDLEISLPKILGAKYFMTLDLLQGYWQALVSEESREYYSFITPWGVYTPTRLPQGAVDSPLYFQASLQRIFDDLIKEDHMILWVDDLVIFAKTWEEFMQVTTRLFNRLKEYNLKVNIKKSSLVNKQAIWCGRLVDGTGFHWLPRNSQAMKDMAHPQTAGELSQFVAGITWMIKGLPRLAEHKGVLQELLEEIQKLTGKKRRKYEHVDLRHLWRDKHRIAFEKCKELLVNSMENTFVKPGATLCLFTDASDRYWAALLTQVVDYDPTKPVVQQNHMPISTMSGAFNGPQKGWSTIEKESYPIIKSVQEWEHYLLNPQGFRMYVDHSNIVSMFNPTTIEPALSKSSIDKVYRWLHILSHFKITHMEYLKGQDNIWADLLSRWAHKEYHQDEEKHSHVFVTKRAKKAVKQKPSPKYRNCVQARNLPEFKLPTEKVIKLSQEIHYDNEFEQLFCPTGETIDPLITTNEHGLILYDKNYWIPSGDLELQQRLLVIAHCGESGHRSIKDATDKLKQHVYWPTLEEDTANFIKNCLCCEKVRDGETVPRPYGRTLVAEYRNHIVAFDFMYIEKPKLGCEHEFQYVLVLKDLYSGMVELVPCKYASHIPVVEALAFWCGRYGTPKILQSDQGSHFKNKILEDLTRRMGIHHHFTFAYCPFSNGAIEIVNRSLKRVLRTAILEQNLKTSDWPYLLPMVMSVINGSKAERLGDLAPRQVYMGLPEYDPFTIIYNPSWGELREIPLDTDEIKMAFEDLMEDLNVMHAEVTMAKAAAREKSHRAWRRRLGLPEEDDEEINIVPDIDFTIGDYVLVAVPNKRRMTKLDAVWRGPYRVTRLMPTGPTELGYTDYDNRIYEVEHLLTGTRLQSHAIRMKFYCDGDLDQNVDLDSLKRHIASQEIEKYELESILKHKFDNDLLAMVVECKWQGFSDLENTWEPINVIYEDAPQVVKAYLNSLTREAATQLRKDLQ